MPDIVESTLPRVQSIVNNIRYKDWRLILGIDGTRLYIQWSFRARNWSLPGHPMHSWTSRKWHLSAYMTESEVVQTALKAAITAEDHEAREAFHYLGLRPFQPHIPLTALLEVCSNIEARS